MTDTTTPTLDEVWELAKKLTIADQQRLVRLLNPPKTFEQLAKEQGIGPLNWEEAQDRAAGIWPEEDSIDDFLAFLRESRKDSAPDRDLGDDDDLDGIPGPETTSRGTDAAPESRIE